MRSSNGLLARIFLKDGRLRPILRAIAYVVATFVCAGILIWVVALLMGLPPQPTKPGPPPYAFLVVSEVCGCVVAVGIALLFRTYIDRRSTSSLGLAFRGPWLRLLSIGILIGAGMQLLVFAADEALGYSHVVGTASIGADALELARYVPLFLAVAVFEEMSMRGYLFQNLWEEWGLIAAVVITSVLFAVAHLGNPNSQANLALTLAGLLAYGVWGCLSFVWTKSLWLAVGVHFAWNLFEGPILGFPVSGLTNFDVTAVRQTIEGPSWFTGGPFGPESGASALLALLLGFAALYWMYRRGMFADAFDAREPYAREQHATQR